MVDRARTVPSTARFGLTDGRAEQELRAAGWWGDEGPVSSREAVLVALSRAPDPDLALRSLDRLRLSDVDGWAELDGALVDDSALRGRLIAVLGASSALADFVISRPGEWRRLVHGGRTAPDEYGATLLAAVGADGSGVAALRGEEAVRALRAAYRGLLLEVAADDLGRLVEPDLPDPGFDEIAGELTRLAEGALRAALAVAWAELGGVQASAARLAVIAMGKCGGRELNYVSDVDVVFVGEGDLGLATRVASAMMRVASKACFEVDAALRPEGKAGALVRTLEGHAAYYRRWARTWEFQALLKARAVAGDAELGARYLETVRPLVWAAAERENFVADVQAMRRRVEKHVPAQLVDRELKLGRGGLRDIEFAVQLLQLVHGRGDEALRLGSTVDALAALGAGGYVGRADAAELGASYRFLRVLEHRLQLQRLRRTHLFPDERDATALRWLARAAGIRPEGSRSEGDVLLAEFRAQVIRIRRLHEKLFYRPLLEAVARVPTEALRLTTKDAEARLAALGYAAPDGALQHIKALTTGVSRRAAIQTALLPVLLDLLADTPDPDGGLLAYRRVSEGLAATPWYLRVLRDEAAVVERLATLLGTSKLVPDLIVRAPEVLRLLGDPAALAGRDPEEVARSLREAVNRHGYLGNAVAAGRSLRRHELLRVACADLLGYMDVLSVCGALSRVWCAVLEAVLRAVDRAEAVAAGGRQASIAVIGMGRLGGAELGYGSDADVMFVCEPVAGVSDSDAVRYASRVAQSVRKLLSAPSQDPPLHVDVDLRPEGRNGALVRTLESYRAYYAQWGEVWEAQALLRARPVAGDVDLGARFIAAIDDVRYPASGLDSARTREIRRIKARVDNERLPRGADPSTHTKLGRGGLADVEWTLQLLQLRHAHRIPALRTTSTMDGLAAAASSGLIDPVDHRALREAWLLATRVRNAATLVRGKLTDQVPTSGRELVAVASVLGHPLDGDPGQFLDSYRRTMRRARTVVERVFYQD
ncbi:MAG TPA: bifunctional [glutamine synthetase] adenylyltransferase/[glutamine synthetase]-adenylyl-L-tyrosine phosphorylase [Actinophytocola sp.]|uniref:bifunctional [glutamine synthetase] adenylyltransferase/[glutamine synthetase]-adenylyl-L-tyrosine phosphorylase n=1 Tax=Actinophytocola sp. TaxID=1872138 RepID=UPI002DDD7C32|nr:bifunctional [glutamine synthetase] adenylyltransferase/[glutamine synthetase]-adenylyl-L-tyrosine phosphorylase [Actinophytocola sp.]HEV2778676.1 bifunctional [glutamine synthetase] adenylyltransferase/[glutamine synthetase]-adenylyl-L-tyrosine phosphorylase [Actinophytocola sp.]